MQTLKIAGLVIAAISAPVGLQTGRVDISGKQHWKLVGAGNAAIEVDSPGSGCDLSIVVTYPDGDHFVTLFEKHQLSGVMMERRVGNMVTILYDDDGDGMPEMRRVFKVMGPDDKRLISAERLKWTSEEIK